MLIFILLILPIAFSVEINVNLSSNDVELDKISPWANFNVSLYHEYFCCDTIPSVLEFSPKSDCDGSKIKYYFNITDFNNNSYFDSEIDLRNNRDNFSNLNYDFSCYQSRFIFNFTQLPFTNSPPGLMEIPLDIEGPDEFEIASFDSTSNNEFKEIEITLESDESYEFLVETFKKDYYEVGCDLDFETSKDYFYVKNNSFSNSLKKGYVYLINITPIDILNNHGEKTSKEIRIRDDLPPSKVNLNGNYFNKKLTLNWSESEDNIGIKRYLVYRSVDSNEFEKIDSSENNSFIDNYLTHGKNHSYFIKPVDCSGNIGNKSNIFSYEIDKKEPKIKDYNIDYFRDGEFTLHLNLSKNFKQIYLLSDDFDKKDSINIQNYSLNINDNDYLTKYNSLNLNLSYNLFDNKSKFNLSLFIVDDLGNYGIYKIPGIKPIYEKPNVSFSYNKRDYSNYFTFISNRDVDCNLNLFNNSNKNVKIAQNEIYNVLDNYLLNNTKKKFNFTLEKNQKLNFSLFLLPEKNNLVLDCYDDYGYHFSEEIKFNISNNLPIEIFSPNNLLNNSKYIFLSLKQDSFILHHNNFNFTLNEFNQYFKNILNVSYNYDYPLKIINLEVLDKNYFEGMEEFSFDLILQNKKFNYKYNITSVETVYSEPFNSSCLLFDFYYGNCSNEVISYFQKESNGFILTPFFIFPASYSGLSTFIFSLIILSSFLLIFYFLTFRSNLTFFNNGSNRSDVVSKNKTKNNETSFNENSNKKEDKKQRVINQWIERVKEKDEKTTTNFKKDNNFKNNESSSFFIKNNNKNKKKDLSDEDDFIFQEDL